MPKTIRANKSGTLRVVIKKHELLKWVPEDVPQALVKHWIEVGRERESLRETFDEQIGEQQRLFVAEIKELQSELSTIKDTLEKFIELFAQLAHLSVIATSIAQYELETIKFKKTNGKLTQDESNKHNLAEIKDKTFRKLLSHLFPQLDHDFLLTNYKKSDE